MIRVRDAAATAVGAGFAWMGYVVATEYAGPPSRRLLGGALFVAAGLVAVPWVRRQLPWLAEWVGAPASDWRGATRVALVVLLLGMAGTAVSPPPDRTATEAPAPATAPTAAATGAVEPLREARVICPDHRTAAGGTEASAARPDRAT